VPSRDTGWRRLLRCSHPRAACFALRQSVRTVAPAETPATPTSAPVQQDSAGSSAKRTSTSARTTAASMEPLASTASENTSANVYLDTQEFRKLLLILKLQ